MPHQNEQTTSPTYVSAKKLAAMFDPPLSIGLVRKMQQGRVVPFLRLGRRVLFDPVAVRQTLATAHTVYPRGQRPETAA